MITREPVKNVGMKGDLSKCPKFTHTRSAARGLAIDKVPAPSMAMDCRPKSVYPTISTARVSAQNPEELLLGAASGCYVITLAIILSNRKVPYTRLELESEGFVVDDGGLRFDRIEHRPTIYVDQPVDHEKISLYAEQAEHACMVSSALRGNVQVTVHPQVLMEPARTT